MTSPITAATAPVATGALAAEKKSVVSENLSRSPGNSTSSPGRTAEEEGLIVTAEKFINSVDEFSAFISRVSRRRDLERRNDFSTSAESYEQLDEDATAKIEKLWRVMRTENTQRGALLLHEARSLFPDESNRVVALRAMLKHRNISEIERELIEQALATEESESDSKRLKSGINVALKARLFGKQLNLSPGMIRESYRNFIESDDNERKIYMKWVMIFGSSRLRMLINFMESALLADMNASDPGCSDIEFGNLSGRLAQIKLIRSVNLLFIHRARKDHFFNAYDFTEDDWNLFLLPILQEPELLSEQLAQLGKAVFCRLTPREKVSFIQKIFNFIRDFPSLIFDSSDQKELLHQEFISLIDSGFAIEQAGNRKF